MGDVFQMSRLMSWRCHHCRHTRPPTTVSRTRKSTSVSVVSTTTCSFLEKATNPCASQCFHHSSRRPLSSSASFQIRELHLQRLYYGRAATAAEQHAQQNQGKQQLEGTGLLSLLLPASDRTFSLLQVRERKGETRVQCVQYG